MKIYRSKLFKGAKMTDDAPDISSFVYSLKEMEYDDIVYNYMLRNKMEYISALSCGSVHMAHELRRVLGENTK